MLSLLISASAIIAFIISLMAVIGGVIGIFRYPGGTVAGMGLVITLIVPGAIGLILSGGSILLTNWYPASLKGTLLPAVVATVAALLSMYVIALAVNSWPYKDKRN